MDSLILRTVSRVACPLLLIVSAYLFFRGHDAPGGGFIAGVLLAGTAVLAVLAFGRENVVKRLKVPGLVISAAGILISVLTGLCAVLLGYPFLTSAHAYRLPFVQEVHFPTAVFFDLGVCVLVIGALFTLMASLGEE